MADVTTTSKTLKIVAGFSDEDSRTLSWDNPKTGLTKEEINSLNSYAQGVLIGDKTGAAFTRILSAKYQTTATTYFDTES